MDVCRFGSAASGCRNRTNLAVGLHRRTALPSTTSASGRRRSSQSISPELRVSSNWEETFGTVGAAAQPAIAVVARRMHHALPHSAGAGPSFESSAAASKGEEVLGPTLTHASGVGPALTITRPANAPGNASSLHRVSGCRFTCGSGTAMEVVPPLCSSSSNSTTPPTSARNAAPVRGRGRRRTCGRCSLSSSRQSDLRSCSWRRGAVRVPDAHQRERLAHSGAPRCC